MCAMVLKYAMKTGRKATRMKRHNQCYFTHAWSDPSQWTTIVHPCLFATRTLSDVHNSFIARHSAVSELECGVKKVLVGHKLLTQAASLTLCYTPSLTRWYIYNFIWLRQRCRSKLNEEPRTVTFLVYHTFLMNACRILRSWNDLPNALPLVVGDCISASVVLYGCCGSSSPSVVAADVATFCAGASSKASLSYTV